MAKFRGKIYLGYEDDVITDKGGSQLNYTINKIGGTSNFPPLDNIQFSIKCPKCSLYRLLVVQCYAPLEGSVYHRTLYVFACINPHCWNQSECWTCVRSQIKDEPKDTTSVVLMPHLETMNFTWCKNADDWGDGDDGDSTNGNVVNMDNNPVNMQRNSDEEDESNSYDLEAVEQALGNLQVDAHNANLSPVQGAVGAIGAPIPAAELEGDECGLVVVDTPTAPANNVQMLFNQTEELPPDIRSRLLLGPIHFVPKYIYVEEERIKMKHDDDKITELLNKYKKNNEKDAGVSDMGGDDDTYEEGVPLHGDRLFHAFVSRLKANPGQILRYSRDEPPLLGALLPVKERTQENICSRCGSNLICELQLVPGFAETLSIAPNKISLSHLHFLSVLIFTCSQSCWNTTDKLVEETVIFQPEMI